FVVLLCCLAPPTPTLFPYTTLFRSGPRDRRLAYRVWARRGGRERDRRRSSSRRGGAKVDLRVATSHVSGDGDSRWWNDGQRRRRDRKSTRLNSSHLGISYAVFCLKK